MTSWYDLDSAARMARTADELTVAAPFFASLFLSQQLESRESIGTMAVDGKRVIYAPSFVAKLSELECLGVAVHESLHLALLHHVRRGSRDPELWNVAADFELNPIAIQSGFVLPKGALIDSRFAGLTAEAIYSALEKERESQGEKADESQGEESQGNDSSEQAAPDPAACGGVLDASDSDSGLADAKADAEAMVRQALSVARSAGDGAIPEALRPIVSTLNAPRIDWRAETAEFIDDSTSKVTSWNVPNRRFLDSEFILPGSVADSVSCVGFAVDCSGSIGRKTLAVFQDLGQSLLDDGRVERLVVVYCHSRVCGTAEFVSGDSVKLEITETGGTRFAPAIAHIESAWPEAVAIVYLTDLEAYGKEAWGDAPSVPVLWTVDGPARKAPFGRVLPIDAHA